MNTSIAIAMAVSFQMSRANNATDLTMENIEALAMADGEGLGCLGGSCSYYESDWVYNPNTNQYEWKEKLVCSACCAEGQSAYCSFSGCECN